MRKLFELNHHHFRIYDQTTFPYLLRSSPSASGLTKNHSVGRRPGGKRCHSGASGTGLGQLVCPTQRPFQRKSSTQKNFFKP